MDFQKWPLWEIDLDVDRFCLTMEAFIHPIQPHTYLLATVLDMA